MTALWKDVEIRWKGETYTVRPTFALMQAIEKIDDLESMVSAAMREKVPSSLVIGVIAAALRSVGVQVSSDDVLDEPEMNSGLGYSKGVFYAILTAFANRNAETEVSKKKPVTQAKQSQ